MKYCVKCGRDFKTCKKCGHKYHYLTKEEHESFGVCDKILNKKIANVR